jgi:hypothetical protein
MAKQVRWSMVMNVEVLVMRNAETILTIIRERFKDCPLESRVR